MTPPTPSPAPAAPAAGEGPDTALAYRVRDHLAAHPELHEQGLWLTVGECGTRACFAGWACILAGDTPIGDGGQVRTPEGVRMHASDRAFDLLCLSGTPGAHEYEDGDHDLFYAEDLPDLDRMLPEVFGPHPTPGAAA